MKKITFPITEEQLKDLKSGDRVLASGYLYTARDAAHKRMSETLAEGGRIPIDLKDNIIYYMGPSPAREGRVIGSAGPTTASRMDKYTPALLDLGLGGMIGKGKRSKEVIDAIIRNKSISVRVGFIIWVNHKIYKFILYKVMIHKWIKTKPTITLPQEI